MRGTERAQCHAQEKEKGTNEVEFSGEIIVCHLFQDFKKDN